MSELSKKSGFNKSIIQHYINSGLLHKPLKTGSTVALYNESHLSRLRRIRELRKKKKLSLSEIKAIFDQEAGPIMESDQITVDKRTEIIEKAIDLFSSHGFTNTKISDVAEAVGLGKSSFYFYFENKIKLFTECVAYLSEKLIQSDAQGEILTEKDYIAKQRVRTKAYLNSFRHYSGIFNSLRTFLRSDNPKLAKLARATFIKYLEPIAADHRSAINAGIMREMDETLVSSALLGTIEGLGYVLLTNTQFTIDDVVNFGIDFVNNGMLAHKK